MLEVIVISNFSTDILTDEQIEALSLWVSRGGFLIVDGYYGLVAGIEGVDVVKLRVAHKIRRVRHGKHLIVIVIMKIL